MDHSDIPNGTLVNAVRYGPGPLVYHVRDQERLTRALPVHRLVSVKGFRSVAVTIDQFRGAIALPDVELVMYGDGVTAPFLATLDGFVSETLKLGINISTPSATVRELLIAAASTFTGRAGSV